jgi:hypothetical protein
VEIPEYRDAPGETGRGRGPAREHNPEVAMAIEVATLAASLVGRILLPYAKLGLKKIGEELKERGSAAVEEQATSLTGKVWEKVTGLFRSDKDQLVLEQFEEDPELAAPIFTKKLEAKLAESPAETEELQRLLEQPVGGSGGPTLQNIMAHNFGYLDARGAQISGGQVAGMIYTAPQPATSVGPRPQPPAGSNPQAPPGTVSR